MWAFSASYLVYRRLPPEVRDGVPSSKQLAKSRVRRKQPLGREHPRELLVGHYELVAGIEVLSRTCRHAHKHAPGVGAEAREGGQNQ